jgi:hypothetical protein
MKPIGRISNGALLLLLGMAAPTYARQEAPTRDTKPLKHQQPAKPRRPQRQADGLSAGAQPAQTAEQVEQQAVWHRARARSFQTQHHTWNQRGGYSGSHIPEEEFRTYYGRGHSFRISRLPSGLVGGRVRFQYGRYWFTLVDPWPEYWPDNWYDTDEAYINYYDDGYYLFNESRRGVRVAVEVVPD